MIYDLDPFNEDRPKPLKPPFDPRPKPLPRNEEEETEYGRERCIAKWWVYRWKLITMED